MSNIRNLEIIEKELDSTTATLLEAQQKESDATRRRIMLQNDLTKLQSEFDTAILAKKSKAPNGTRWKEHRAMEAKDGTANGNK